LIQAGIHDTSAITYLYALPPGTPRERVQALRAAFDKTMKDPEFLADTKKANTDVDPVSGEDLERLVGGFFELDTAVLRKQKEILKTVASGAQMAELVKIPITGLSTSHKKIAKQPDEIVRVLRALRAATLFVLSERELGVGLMEKTLKLDRQAAEKFYSLYREQYNPELTVANSVVEEWIAVGTFRAKEKEKATVEGKTVHDWTFAERAKQ
jgi:hypothetical protein